MAKIMAFGETADYTVLEEMRRDETIFMYGWRGFYDTLRGVPRSEWPSIMEEFGYQRLAHSGICETQMAGAGVGAALAGARPIVSIRSDFTLETFGQICLQAAKMRFKLAYKLDCPVVFRVDFAGPTGKTVHHAGCYQNWLANAPGLFVAVPSTPADVRGLWRTALRTTKDPVVMMENMDLRSVKGPVPDGDYTIPFGKADIKRRGSDVTIAAVGYWVYEALEVAEDLAKEGIDAEVWDPRTLAPLDKESLVNSVLKTGAMVVVDQQPKTFGTTGEFFATVGEAITPVPPMARVATMDVPIAASPSLTNYAYPSKAKIIAAVKGVLKRKGSSSGVELQTK